jgi:nitroreductase
VEFREVLRRRRMVRRYDEHRPVPEEVVERLVAAAVRAPSAGFVQGWGFLVLDEPEDLARFRAAVTPDDGPERFFAAQFRAPLLIVPHANKDAYLDRYAQPDKGLERSEDAWPAPFWDIDVGFASMLILLACVDEGLGACFFGLPVERIDAYRAAFDVPEPFRPIGAISIGYPRDAPTDVRAARTPLEQVVHRGRWNR